MSACVCLGVAYRGEVLQHGLQSQGAELAGGLLVRVVGGHPDKQLVRTHTRKHAHTAWSADPHRIGRVQPGHVMLTGGGGGACVGAGADEEVACVDDGVDVLLLACVLVVTGGGPCGGPGGAARVTGRANHRDDSTARSKKVLRREATDMLLDL